MRPLVRCSGRGRLLALSVHHVLAQAGPGQQEAQGVAGLIGAAVALMLMLMLAGSARSHMVIMAGLAISTVSGAALATVLNFAPNPYAMQELVFWLLGSDRKSTRLNSSHVKISYAVF